MREKCARNNEQFASARTEALIWSIIRDGSVQNEVGNLFSRQPKCQAEELRSPLQDYLRLQVRCKVTDMDQLLVSPQNSYVQALPPNIMALGVGSLGGNQDQMRSNGGALMSGISILIKVTRELASYFCSVRTQ